MSLRATCPSCPKSYKVPHNRKEWRCKECDSVLEIEEAESTHTGEDDGESCSACGAVNFGDAAFCEECGEPLGEKAPARSGLTRKEAAGDMRKAMKRIGRLKTWLGLNLVLNLMATALLVLFLMSADDVSGKAIAIASGIQMILLGLSYAAYRYVDRKPFPIIIALASLQTLGVIWKYSDGAIWIPSLVWALLLWWLVTDAAHATKLAAEHPDLYAAKRMRGDHLTHKKGDRDGSDSVRERAAGRGSAGTNWWVLGGVIAAVIALGVGVFQASKKSSGFNEDGRKAAMAVPTTSPREATEAFRAAWNSHDIDSLGRLTKESLREKMKGSLLKLGERYEWGIQFPQLEPAVFQEPKISNIQVVFPSEAGDFPVRFVVENGDWVIRTIKTSPLKEWRP